MQTKHILPKWKQSMLSKDQANRAWLMFRSGFFFLCELLSKSRIHERKKEPWFTSRALGEYIWQKDLKFRSSSFKNTVPEINYFHYIAASELLHWNYSFWTSAWCATQLSRAIRHQENTVFQCCSLSGSDSYQQLSDGCLFFVLIIWLENEKIINSLIFNRALF